MFRIPGFIDAPKTVPFFQKAQTSIHIVKVVSPLKE